MSISAHVDMLAAAGAGALHQRRLDRAVREDRAEHVGDEHRAGRRPVGLCRHSAQACGRSRWRRVTIIA